MERRKSDSAQLSGETFSSTPAQYAYSPSTPTWEDWPEDGDWPLSRPSRTLVERHGFAKANGRDSALKWDEESMLERLLALYDDHSRDPNQDSVEDTGDQDRVVHEVACCDDITSDSGTVEIHVASSPLTTPSEDRDDVDHYQDETPVYLARTNRTQAQKTGSRFTGDVRSSPKTPNKFCCSPRSQESLALSLPASAGPRLSRFAKDRKSTRPKTPWKSSSLEDFRLKSKSTTTPNKQRDDAMQIGGLVSPKKIPAITLRHPSEPAPLHDALKTRSPNIIGVAKACTPPVGKQNIMNTESDWVRPKSPPRVWNGSWFMPVDDYVDYLGWLKYGIDSGKHDLFNPPRSPDTRAASLEKLRKLVWNGSSFMPADENPDCLEWTTNRQTPHEVSAVDLPNRDTSTTFLARMRRLEASCQSHESSRFNENSPISRANFSNGREPRCIENKWSLTNIHESKYLSLEQCDMRNESRYIDEDMIEPSYQGNNCSPDTDESNFSTPLESDTSNLSPMDESLLVPRTRLIYGREPYRGENAGLSNVHPSIYPIAVQNGDIIESLSYHRDPLSTRRSSFSDLDSSNKDTVTPSRVRQFQLRNTQQNGSTTDRKEFRPAEQNPPSEEAVVAAPTRNSEPSGRATPPGLATRLYSGLVSPKLSPKLWLDLRFPSSKYFPNNAVGSRLVSAAELPGSEVNTSKQVLAVQFPTFQADDGLSPEDTGIIPYLNMEIYDILGGKDFGLRMMLDVVVGITPRILFIDRRDMDLQFSTIDGCLATSKAAEWRIESDGDYALFRSEKMSKGQVVRVEMYWRGKAGGLMEMPVVLHQVVLAGEVWHGVDEATLILNADDGEEMGRHYSERHQKIFLPPLKSRYGISVSFATSVHDSTPQQDHLKDLETLSEYLDAPPMLHELESPHENIKHVQTPKWASDTNAFPSLRTLLNAVIIGTVVGFCLTALHDPDVRTEVYGKVLGTWAEYPYPYLRRDVANGVDYEGTGGESVVVAGDVVGVDEAVGGLENGVEGIHEHERRQGKGEAHEADEHGVRDWIDRKLGWRGV